jgi:hypothetical protein
MKIRAATTANTINTTFLCVLPLPEGGAWGVSGAVGVCPVENVPDGASCCAYTGVSSREMVSPQPAQSLAPRGICAPQLGQR